MNNQETVDMIDNMINVGERLHHLATIGILIQIIFIVLLKNDIAWSGKLKILGKNTGIISIITAIIVTMLAQYYENIDDIDRNGETSLFFLLILTMISLGNYTAQSKKQKIIMGPVAIAVYIFILKLLLLR